MAAATVTAVDLIAQYAQGIAVIAAEAPATTLPGFIEQLEVAAENLFAARIQGVDLKLAAIDLQDGADIGSAARYLAGAADLVAQYRLAA